MERWRGRMKEGGEREWKEGRRKMERCEMLGDSAQDKEGKTRAVKHGKMPGPYSVT